MKICITAFSLLASIAAGVDDFNRDLQGCVNHVLTIVPDEYAVDISIDYQCNGEQIWSYAAGDFFEPFETIRLTECIAEDATCDLVIGDDALYADGLTSPEQGKPGFIAYVVGDEVVGFYEANGPRTDYAVLEFCHGSLCSAARNVGVGGVQDCGQFVSMATTFDEFPSETSWTMVCDGAEVWNRDGFLPDQQFETIESYACVAATACCSMVFRDSEIFADGLVSPQDGEPGGFIITLGTQKVAEYDGSAPNAEFEVLTYQFGAGCGGGTV